MTGNIEKVGIAGVGALGGIVARSFPLDGYTLHRLSDPNPKPEFDVPNVDLETLVRDCDVIVECLPAAAAHDLAHMVLKTHKTMIMISSCALVLYPELSTAVEKSRGRILVPSGALAGLDGVQALAQAGIDAATIISTKPPAGFRGAPYILANKIDVDSITEKTMFFSGNVFEAAKAFPANVNVAASLALSGIGPEKTRVEVWADPAAKGNAHEIEVMGRFSTIRAKIENTPDPSNPKSSMQAAYSILAALKKRKSPLTSF